MYENPQFDPYKEQQYAAYYQALSSNDPKQLQGKAPQLLLNSNLSLCSVDVVGATKGRPYNL